MTQVVIPPGEHSREGPLQAGIVIQASITAKDFVDVVKGEQHDPLGWPDQADQQGRQGQRDPDIQGFRRGAKAQQQVVPPEPLSPPEILRRMMAGMPALQPIPSGRPVGQAMDAIAQPQPKQQGYKEGRQALQQHGEAGRVERPKIKEFCRDCKGPAGQQRDRCFRERA